MKWCLEKTFGKWAGKIQSGLWNVLEYLLSASQQECSVPSLDKKCWNRIYCSLNFNFQLYFSLSIPTGLFPTPWRPMSLFLKWGPGLREAPMHLPGGPWDQNNFPSHVVVVSCWVMSNIFVMLCTDSPSSPVHSISQARILEWVAISFSRGSSWPRDRIPSPAWQVDFFFFLSESPGKPFP